MSRTIKPRNPYAREAFTRTGAGSHRKSVKAQRTKDKALLRKYNGERED